MNTSICRIQREGDTVVLTPQADLGEFDFEQLSTELEKVRAWLQTGEVCNVVVDLYKTDYFGSETIGLFIGMRRLARQHGGMMILCGLSAHETEILRTVKLDRIWTVCATRHEALERVRQIPPSTKPRRRYDLLGRHWLSRHRPVQPVTAHS